MRSSPLHALGLALWIALPAAAPAQEQVPVRREHFSWLSFLAGAATSIAAHEASHVATALVLGGSPSLNLDKGRPVIRSGIDASVHPARQFTFSAAGMSTQLVINELLLDLPRGSQSAGEFERGVLAGGVATAVFYFTIGRNAAVSDVQQMAANSGLSKWALTGIFGGVALSDVVRIATHKRYANFFAVPGRDANLLVGVGFEF